MQVRVWTATGLLLGTLASCGAAHADDTADATPAAHVARAPNPDYRAGGLHTFLMGSGYRRLWATPIDVEVLDLARFSGGLTPHKKGGGKQTLSLRFKAADGREWKFRSIDKDPTPVLPKVLHNGPIDRMVQDQISASHPGNALVVDALARAVDIPVVPRRFVVLPDDERLGEFRKQFAGMLGTLEEEPSVKAPVTPGFERFSEIVELPDLWERMDADPAERIDARALLRARLFDVWIGDYDRHKDQWDLGKDRGSGLWVPIPKDRDLAFVDFDGLLLDLVRHGAPRLVKFDERYPSIEGLTWQGRFVDRRSLAELAWPDWEQAVQDLTSRLTDSVIDEAVRREPREMYAIDGAELAHKLKARRDRLAKAARKYYALLARQAEVHGTNQAETVDAVREPDGSLDLTARSGGETYFHRRYLPNETDEVRVYLKGGDDRTVAHGDGKADVKLRVVGGDGADLLDDREAGHTRFYDTAGENGVQKGPGTKVSDRPYTAPLDGSGNPQRDWGSRTLIVPWFRAGGGLGVVLGTELLHQTYGFRRHPWASQHRLRVGYSTRLSDFGSEYEYESRRTDNRMRLGLEADISQLGIIHYHGFGNETAAPAAETFYEVKQRQYSLAPAYRLELDPVDISIGPVAKYSDTFFDHLTLLAVERPYGSDGFGQVGARLGIRMDRTDYGERAATRGVLIDTQANVYAPVWTVESTFGEAHGTGAVYLSAPVPVLHPTLALRAGGQKIWGRYPFQEAAFIGGTHTVRGLRTQRYAGDASAYGNAELRFALRDQPEYFAGRLGVFGLVDTGRVFVRGESSNRWHTSVGGGVWMSLNKPDNVVSLSVATTEGRVRVYLEGGMMF